MARKMCEAAFRRSQFDHRMDPHIAPINELVARLQNRDGRGWLPEVAPVHGGVCGDPEFIREVGGPDLARRLNLPST
jgi:hypothetical protein